MIETISKFFTQNQLISGGVLLLFGGSIIGVLWKSWSYIIHLFNYLFFVQISFTNEDTSFFSIQNWLFSQEYTKKRCSNLMVRNIIGGIKSSLPEYNEKNNLQIFVPGYGNHYLFIKGKPAFISYTKSDNKDLKNREYINIKIFCIFNKFFFSENIIKEADSIFYSESYKETNIYTCIDRHSGFWELVAKKRIKQYPILSSSIEYNNLVIDINNFLDNEEWYNNRGINYKRGYLFQGSPGNGKSSTILALAQCVKRHLYILNIADTNMDDSKFMELISRMPPNVILSIEDIDAGAQNRKDPKNGIKKTLSLSALLNVLDGPLTPNSFLYFISTNYPEKLDEALIRPGRIDVVKTFDVANEYQCRTIFRRFLPDSNIEDENKFVGQNLGKPMSSLESKLLSKCML